MSTHQMTEKTEYTVVTFLFFGKYDFDSGIHVVEHAQVLASFQGVGIVGIVTLQKV